jgi:Ca2+/Na+ antiporter
MNKNNYLIFCIIFLFLAFIGYFFMLNHWPYGKTILYVALFFSVLFFTVWSFKSINKNKFEKGNDIIDDIETKDTKD